MRGLPWVAALAFGVGFAAFAPAPDAGARSCDCGGWQYEAAGRSCRSVCPGNEHDTLRWRRGGRRVRSYEVDRVYPYGFERIRPRVDTDAANDDLTARAIRERGRVAAYAAYERSWRLWHRPPSVYGPPPTAPSNVRSLLAEERSAELPGVFCVEGEVVYPTPATPAARTFCRKGR